SLASALATQRAGRLPASTRPLLAAASLRLSLVISFFFFIAPPPPAFSPLSLHDALPICRPSPASPAARCWPSTPSHTWTRRGCRSEEHTSELQSRFDLVCRLLLEKKKNGRNRGLHVRRARVRPRLGRAT